MSLQKQIDAINYPPTHQYNLKPLQSKGELKKRYGIK